jgi:hypothetical protein
MVGIGQAPGGRYQGGSETTRIPTSPKRPVQFGQRCLLLTADQATFAAGRAGHRILRDGAAILDLAAKEA